MVGGVVIGSGEAMIMGSDSLFVGAAGGCRAACKCGRRCGAGLHRRAPEVPRYPDWGDRVRYSVLCEHVSLGMIRRVRAIVPRHALKALIDREGGIAFLERRQHDAGDAVDGVVDRAS